MNSILLRAAKLICFAIVAIGLPVASGYSHQGIGWPLLWIGLLTCDNLRTGWRHDDQSGLLKSALIGLMFGAIFVLPSYFLGRWVAGI